MPRSPRRKSSQMKRPAPDDYDDDDGARPQKTPNRSEQILILKRNIQTYLARFGIRIINTQIVHISGASRRLIAYLAPTRGSQGEAALDRAVNRILTNRFNLRMEGGLVADPSSITAIYDTIEQDNIEQIIGYYAITCDFNDINDDMFFQVDGNGRMLQLLSQLSYEVREHVQIFIRDFLNLLYED